MSATRVTAMRAALRPAARRLPQRRLQSTYNNSTPGTERGGRPTGSPVGNKSTTKEAYGPDGGSANAASNKNLMYIGAAALAVGGVYSMFLARPEKVADVGYKTDPDAVAKHRAQR